MGVSRLGGNDALDNLCAIIDVNRLGQSGPTMLQHDMEIYKARWEAFGWHAIVVDGHDMSALLKAFDEAEEVKGKPTMILARTLKGKGISASRTKTAGTARRSRKKKPIAPWRSWRSRLRAKPMLDANCPISAPPRPSPAHRCNARRTRSGQGSGHPRSVR